MMNEKETDFLQPTKELLKWFKSWPGATFHDGLEFADLRAHGAGRGIVAKEDIAQETVLFTIPRSSVLCLATSELASLIPSIASLDKETEGSVAEDESEDHDANGPWTALILVMIYEFLRGDKSPWKPYLNVLPALFDTPMFWSSNELSELQASPVLGRVGRSEADEMIGKKVLPMIRKHANIFFPDETPPLSDEELFGLAHRMGSTIMAYSFSLEKDDEKEQDEKANSASDADDNAEADKDDQDLEMADGNDGDDDNDDDNDDDDDSNDGWEEDTDDQLPLGMVPMADMLNADAEFNAHISHGIDALTAVAVRPIKAGDEVLNYYGPLSNGELLRRYGYTTRHHEHFDAVDIPWQLVEQAVASHLSISSADMAKLRDVIDADNFDDPVMLDREFVEDSSTGHLSAPASGRVISELPVVLRKQTRTLVKAAVRRTEKAKAKENKKRARTANEKLGQKLDPDVICSAAMGDAIASRLAAYPTLLADDVALLQKLSEARQTAGSRRLHAAVRVRVGEKRLLVEAAEIAKKATSQPQCHSRKHSTDEQVSPKRQKTQDNN